MDLKHHLSLQEKKKKKKLCDAINLANFSMMELIVACFDCIASLRFQMIIFHSHRIMTGGHVLRNDAEDCVMTLASSREAWLAGQQSLGLPSPLDDEASEASRGE